MNLLMSTALNFLWGMINGVQILSIMPLIDCDMPGNAQSFLKQIYLIASFNLVDASFLTTKISQKLNIKDHPESISKRLAGFGFNSASQINNLGIVFVFFMIVAFYIIALLILSWIAQLRFIRIQSSPKVLKF